MARRRRGSTVDDYVQRVTLVDVLAFAVWSSPVPRPSSRRKRPAADLTRLARFERWHLAGYRVQRRDRDAESVEDWLARERARLAECLRAAEEAAP